MSHGEVRRGSDGYYWAEIDGDTIVQRSDGHWACIADAESAALAVLKDLTVVVAPSAKLRIYWNGVDRVTGTWEGVGGWNLEVDVRDFVYDRVTVCSVDGLVASFEWVMPVPGPSTTDPDLYQLLDYLSGPVDYPMVPTVPGKDPPVVVETQQDRPVWPPFKVRRRPRPKARVR